MLTVTIAQQRINFYLTTAAALFEVVEIHSQPVRVYKSPTWS